jgi:transposase
VGPLVSTATLAAIGSGAAFRKGREFAAWLGLVPRQHSTGGKVKLFGISKRGNIYLRRMFIHGDRAVLLRVKHDTDGFGQWVHQLEARAQRNKVIVAIAKQAGANRLSGAGSGWELPGHARRRGSIEEQVRTSPSDLLRREQDEPTVKRRARKPAANNGSW